MSFIRRLIKCIVSIKCEVICNVEMVYLNLITISGLSVVSLDKALETNHLSTHVGDNVEIKCDVNGSPVPPIVWQRYGVDLATSNEDGVRVLSDGSLYLTDIQLTNAGNYSCHAQRNKDVVQTHILNVQSEFYQIFAFSLNVYVNSNCYFQTHRRFEFSLRCSRKD